MLFNFQLCPLNQIPPQDKPLQPNLTWFGLSYGIYWLDAGGAELFRYSRALVDLWAEKYPDPIWPPDMPYVDYQVGELWDDVIELLPAILEPIPPPLARTLGPDGPWATWQRHAEAALRVPLNASLPLEEADDLLYDACRWWGRRSLNTEYLLQAGPDIVFWSDGTEIYIEWDNRGLMLEDLPAWDAQLGEYRLPIAAFLDEVHAFDARFIRRMHDRVALVQTEWKRPDIALVPGLNAAQAENARYLSKRMMPGFRREPDDWDQVYAAIARIEELPPFASGTVPRLL